MEQHHFQNIIEHHYESLFRFAFSLTKNEQDAKDLTQDLFVRWAEKGHQLRDPSKAKSWLFTTMYRLFIGTTRRPAHRRERPIDEHHDQLPVVHAQAAENCQALEVVTAMEKMDDTFRIPLTLYYLRQHTYTEIADILGLPVGTVMSRLSRGRQHLRNQLERSV